MPYIVLVGPHAVGKTTAANRWGGRYKSLEVYHCDGVKPPSNAVGRVVLLEGCSAMANRWLPEVVPTVVIHTYCTPSDLQSNMKARCLARGKKYREDYWTPRWLAYEARTRMDNLLSKRLPTVPTKSFLIASKEVDWPLVDDFFSSAFRRLWNEVVRCKVSRQ